MERVRKRKIEGESEREIFWLAVTRSAFELVLPQNHLEHCRIGVIGIREGERQREGEKAR